VRPQTPPPPARAPPSLAGALLEGRRRRRAYRQPVLTPPAQLRGEWSSARPPKCRVSGEAAANRRDRGGPSRNQPQDMREAGTGKEQCRPGTPWSRGDRSAPLATRATECAPESRHSCIALDRSAAEQRRRRAQLEIVLLIETSLGSTISAGKVLLPAAPRRMQREARGVGRPSSAQSIPTCCPASFRAPRSRSRCRGFLSASQTSPRRGWFSAYEFKRGELAGGASSICLARSRSGGRNGTRPSDRTAGWPRASG